MANYDFSYLTDPDNQCTTGSIQNDEALLLFSVVRCSRIRRILEIGSLRGYSARNFCEAVKIFHDGIVYSCDNQSIPPVAPNHRFILKWAEDLTPRDVDCCPLGMIFFDAHHISLPRVLDNMAAVITDETIIAFHDTNRLYRGSNAVTLPEPDVHHVIEAEMVNHLHSTGYGSFSVRTKAADHDNDFPVRMGVTLMQKFKAR
jgi:hypothetical protein